MIDLELCKLGHQLKYKQLPMPILSLFNSRGWQKNHRYSTHSKDLPNIQTHAENKFNQSFLCQSIISYGTLPMKIKQTKSPKHFTASMKQNVIHGY